MSESSKQKDKITTFMKQVNTFLKKESKMSLKGLEIIQGLTKELLTTLEDKIDKKRREIPSQVIEAFDSMTIIGLEDIIEDGVDPDCELRFFLQEFFRKNLKQHIRDFVDGEDLSNAISYFFANIVLQLNELDHIKKIYTNEYLKENKDQRLILAFDQVYIYNLKEDRVVYHGSLYQERGVNIGANKLYLAYINSSGSNDVIMMNDMQGDLPDAAADIGNNNILFLGNKHYSMDEVLLNIGGSFIHPSKKDLPKEIIRKEANKFASNIRARSIKTKKTVNLEFGR